MVKRWVQVFLLVALSIQAIGCVALLIGGAAGAGGVIWIKGKLQEEFNSSLTQVHTATLGALKELELPIIEDKKDQMSAKIESRFADGKTVWIDIDAITNTSCKITIRVGTFGDEARSRKILDKIHRHLGMK